jgi:hypothetical protein
MVLFCVTEGVARLIYTTSQTTTAPCLILNDTAGGVRGVPNARCQQKIPESRLTTFVFNRCGHRAGTECGPKPPDTYRIVMVGSSFAFGMWVEREQSFAALLETGLSHQTGRKIEIYNEAMQWGTPHSVAVRFGEVLAAQPDMVLWPITPYDIENADLLDPGAATPRGGAPLDCRLESWRRYLQSLWTTSPGEAVAARWQKSLGLLNCTRTIFLLQHWLYQSQTEYLEHYLADGPAADFLRRHPSQAWQRDAAQFAQYVADIQARTASVGARLVVVVLPNRAQAALISLGHWPENFDPYGLGARVENIVSAAGGSYLDVLHDFQQVPAPEQYYFPVDGHLDPAGHAVVARILSKALTEGPQPVVAAR